MPAMSPTVSKSRSAAAEIVNETKLGALLPSAMSTSAKTARPTNLKPSGLQWSNGSAFQASQLPSAPQKLFELRLHPHLGRPSGRHRARRRPSLSCPWKRTPRNASSTPSSTLAKARRISSMLSNLHLLLHLGDSLSPMFHPHLFSAHAVGRVATIPSLVQPLLI